MFITAEQLRKIFPNLSIQKSNYVAGSLNKFGVYAGIQMPHRLAMFLAQLGHESNGFTATKEKWGPTKQQLKYDPSSGSKLSKDLGNTKPGDGKKYMGRGFAQLTGRDNITRFNTWCKKANLASPNFVDQPEKISESPWDMVSALFYWVSKRLYGQPINNYADRGDMELVTKAINGGLTGYNKRLALYDRASLVLLGYAPTDIKGLQKDKGIVVDGLSGPRTRAAMHEALLDLTPKKDRPSVTSVAPVVDTSIAKKELDKPLTKHPAVIAGGGGIVTTAVNGICSSLSDYRTAIVFCVFTIIILVGLIWWVSYRKKKDSRQVAALSNENIF